MWGQKVLVINYLENLIFEVLPVFGHFKSQCGDPQKFVHKFSFLSSKCAVKEVNNEVLSHFYSHYYLSQDLEVNREQKIIKLYISIFFSSNIVYDDFRYSEVLWNSMQESNTIRKKQTWKIIEANDPVCIYFLVIQAVSTTFPRMGGGG